MFALTSNREEHGLHLHNVTVAMKIVLNNKRYTKKLKLC